jgi:hypothetical protein
MRIIAPRLAAVELGESDGVRDGFQGWLRQFHTRAKGRKIRGLNNLHHTRGRTKKALARSPPTGGKAVNRSLLHVSGQ